MNKWYIFNSLLIGYALFKVFTQSLRSTILIGLFSLLLILCNWTRHAVFSTIRNSENRQTKIAFASFSKQILPFHKWIGTMALLFVILHGILVIQSYGLAFQSPKIATGFIAAIILFSLVLSGWFRWYKTTPMKRYVHWGLGFAIFFFVLIHLIV